MSVKVKTEHEEVSIPEKYHYATMPLSVVDSMLRVPVPEDAYLSADAESRALKELLQKGYRWVRTDGDVCVFEKKTGLLTPVSKRR